MINIIEVKSANVFSTYRTVAVTALIVMPDSQNAGAQCPVSFVLRGSLQLSVAPLSC